MSQFEIWCEDVWFDITRDDWPVPVSFLAEFARFVESSVRVDIAREIKNQCLEKEDTDYPYFSTGTIWEWANEISSGYHINSKNR